MLNLGIEWSPHIRKLDWMCVRSFISSFRPGCNLNPWSIFIAARALSNSQPSPNVCDTLPPPPPFARLPSSTTSASSGIMGPARSRSSRNCRGISDGCPGIRGVCFFTHGWCPLSCLVHQPLFWGILLGICVAHYFSVVYHYFGVVEELKPASDAINIILCVAIRVIYFTYSGVK